MKTLASRILMAFLALLVLGGSAIVVLGYFKGNFDIVYWGMSVIGFGLIIWHFCEQYEIRKQILDQKAEDKEVTA